MFALHDAGALEEVLGGDREEGISDANFVQIMETNSYVTVMTAMPDTGSAQDIVNNGLKTKSGDSLMGPIRYYSYSVNVVASNMDTLMQSAGGRVGIHAQYAVLDVSGGGKYR